MTSADVVQRHLAAGRFFEAGGVRSFVREEGAGEAVVCLHGVPSSCFLYRKVIAELARRGLRGIAFDLPGLGLAERPPDHDYSWSGLGHFAEAAIDALGIDRFHLVVHDIGGPVGMQLAVAMRERVRSLTVLDAMIDLEPFRRPWSMAPFARRGIGEAWLASLTGPAFLMVMWLQGVKRRSAVPREELYAYADLLKRDDGGAAFLKIMRGFELTPERQELHRRAVSDVPYPVQAVWASDDPALPLERDGEALRRMAGLEEVTVIPAKHFPQEDQAPAVAEHVAALAREA